MGQSIGKSQDVEEEMAREGEVGPESSGEASDTQRCPFRNLKIVFAIFSVFTTIFAVWTIIVSLGGAVIHQRYNADQSGRSIGLLLVLVSSFIALAVVVLGIIAIIKSKARCIHVVAGALVVVALFQVVLASTAVRLSQDNENAIISSLNQSFLQSGYERNKEHKLWSITQNALQCCGVIGPVNYKDASLPEFFDPKVTISCCPSYNPNDSENAQETKRARCILSRSYYKKGCQEPVLDLFRGGAKVTLTSLIGLILCELVLAVLSGVIFSKKGLRSTVTETSADKS